MAARATAGGTAASTSSWALHDPIGTVVTGAHPGNVDAVFVAGRRVDPSLPAEAAAALRASATRVAT
ncbi:MAG TPA: hypothetical protein VGL39_15530 [Jatrophihabitantaceae bacterium]